MENATKPEEVMKNAILKRIAEDKNHGWNAEDSLSVILELVSHETGTTSEDLAGIAGFIKFMINPSQVRQTLESKKLLNEPEKGSRKVAGGLKSFL